MKKSDTINVCLACDENYSKLAGVSIASILKSADEKDNLHFYILDNGIKQESKNKILELKKIKECEITFATVNEELFKTLQLPKQKGYLSISAYFRFCMPSLFKDVDKILYIDCDVIATSSLAEFFNTDLTGKLAAVIKDTSCETNQKILGFKPEEIYFNSGVMLVNLEKFRQDGIEKKLFEVSEQGYDDQDSLNIVLKNQTIVVDDTWNWQGKAKNYKEKVPPKLIHFITAYKPYLTGLKTSFNKEYFKALKDTPWDNFYDQYLRRFLPVIHKDRKFIHFCLWGIKTRVKYTK